MVPAGSAAIVANVTVTNTTAPGFLVVYPSTDSTRPNISSINWFAGQTVPNLVTVALGNGTIDFYNASTGSTDVIVDLEGYYQSASSTSGGAGHYYPILPRRIVDTRPGTGTPYSGDTLGAGGNPETLAVSLLGRGGLPTGGVSAVVANVTVTGTTALSFLTIWPAGEPEPNASNLNWVAGQTVANRVTVPLGVFGSWSIANNKGAANVIIDIDGYYTDSSGSASQGSLFVPINPTRIVDTRSGLGGVSGPIPPDHSVTFTAAGVAGIPAASSTQYPDAIVANVTEASATAAGGFVTVYPDGIAPPVTSDLNFGPGDIVANADLAGLNPETGTFEVFNAFGDTQLVVDAYGYFTPASPGANIVTLSPSTSSLEATGTTTSTIAINVVSAAGVPVGNDVINLSLAGSPSSACGTLSAASVTTSTAGSASVTYTSSATTGSCTITAQESAASGQGQTVITQTTALNNVSVSTSVGSIIDDGTSTATITVNVTDATGAPVSSGTANLSLSGNPSAACGTLSSTSVAITGGTGTATYTSSTTQGVCTIQATFPNNATPGYAQLAQISQTPSSTYTISGPGTLSLPADGQSQSYLTFTVRDKEGVPVANDLISLDLNGTCGTLSVAQGETNSMGELATVYTASAIPGSCTIGAAEANTGGTGTFTISQTVAPASVVVSASPQGVVASSSNAVQISVTVTNSSGALTDDSLQSTLTPSVSNSSGSS
ncbi:MAG: Ig-like domain-containing protein, partial [Nitrososphaerota archaeon]